MTPTARQRAMMRQDAPAQTGDTVPAPPLPADSHWASALPPFAYHSYTRTVAPPAVSDEDDRDHLTFRLSSDAHSGYQLGLDWRDMFSSDRATVTAHYSALDERNTEYARGERTWGRALNMGSRKVPQDRTYRYG